MGKHSKGEVIATIRSKGIEIDEKIPMHGRPAKHYFVYAIRLDQAVWEKPKFSRQNPEANHHAECYYVGMTGRTPQLRFEQHLKGYKACRFVTEFGVELMPQRFSHCNAKTYNEAQRFERRLARRLRQKGFGVWQN